MNLPFFVNENIPLGINAIKQKAFVLLADTRFWVIFSLTLGLAPFLPEPHLWGKIRWVAGGAVGMTGMDWFDLFFHGFPWIGLLVSLGIKLNKTLTT